MGVGDGSRETGDGRPPIGVRAMADDCDVAVGAKSSEPARIVRAGRASRNVDRYENMSLVGNTVKYGDIEKGAEAP